MNKYWRKPDEDEKWTLKSIHPNGILVIWQEKYGEKKSQKCTGLWETKDKYRLTFKDSNYIELLKTNINSIEVK